MRAQPGPLGGEALTPYARNQRMADRAALARVGESVRARLADDPAAYRVPVDLAEIFALAAAGRPVGRDGGRPPLLHVRNDGSAQRLPAHPPVHRQARLQFVV